VVAPAVGFPALQLCADPAPRRSAGGAMGYDCCMAISDADLFATPRTRTLGGALVLAACLFTATICLGMAIVWLVDPAAEPGRWLVGLPLVALAALGVSAFADHTWSARRTRTTELGNTTRLFAIVSMMLLVPTGLMQVVGAGDEVSARGIDGACPADRLPATTFEDLAPGSVQEGAVRCLAWWGVVRTGGSTYAPGAEVSREQMATFLDRLVAVAGAPLADAALRHEDSAASTHAGAIARVDAAGLMTGGAEVGFAPGQPVSRGQLSALVDRAHTHLTGRDLPRASGRPFLDVGASPHRDSIEAVAVAGVATGTGGASFRPDAAVDRAQLAVVLARTLDLWVTEGEVALPG
jgi:hypothetical protein